ncbi:MAG TPA: glycosyltransferase family 2 protein [Planctomycetia bacterium]|nr:glycosyltransferase family 2 protein [Planctomycetia bacterium]
MTARVAAVIVNYRTPGLTLDCVRSLRQAAPTTRILVVENASGDDSAQRLAAELSDDELIVARSNGGYTAGNNLGIEQALAECADYVLILNPDAVVVEPAFLDRLIAFLEANPNVGAVGPRVFLRHPGNVQNTVIKFPWLWRRAVDWVKYRLHGPARRCGDEPVEAEVLNGVCVLFRAACLKETGLFDERTFAYLEDVEWAYRAQAKGWRRMYCPTDSIVHLQKESGYERESSVDYLLKRNTLYFLLKTRRFVQAAGYTAATLGLSLGRSRSWLAKLSRAYYLLWTARWQACMGRP